MYGKRPLFALSGARFKGSGAVRGLMSSYTAAMRMVAALRPVLIIV